jgi:hypothetical protein
MAAWRRLWQGGRFATAAIADSGGALLQAVVPSITSIGKDASITGAADARPTTLPSILPSRQSGRTERTQEINAVAAATSAFGLMEAQVGGLSNITTDNAILSVVTYSR